MAEVLSQKEVDDLLKTIEEGKRGEEKEKINPAGAESAEFFEQRERVLTLIHDFYQERQKNLPIHKEILSLAENLKGFYEKAIYFNKKWFESTEDRVVEDLWSKERYNIGIRFRQKDGSIEQQRGNTTIDDLIKVLNNADLEEKEKKELEELIADIQKTENTLDLKVDELWEIRKNIAKELIKNSPEFQNFKDADFQIKKAFINIPDYFYDLNTFVAAVKIVESETGAEENSLFFDFGSIRFKDFLENLEQNYNVTEQELNEIKKLDWSGEDRKNLEFFTQDIREWENDDKEGLLKLENSMLKMQSIKFNKERAERVKREFKEGFVEALYEAYKFPPQHKGRVMQEIMNGTFSF